MSTQVTLNNIQMLRAIAAMAVVLFHISFIGVGSFGVDIFFIISGFVICYVTASDPTHFLLKRIFRIVPLYWAGTLGVYAVALLMPTLLKSTTADPQFLLKSLLFIPAIRESGVVQPVLFLGWTLNYEMFFYLVFATALAISTRYAPWIAAVLLAGIVLLGACFPVQNVAYTFWTDSLLLEFVLGIFAYLAWQRCHMMIRPLHTRWLLLAAACSVLVLVVIQSFQLAIDIPRFIRFGLPATAVFFTVLLLEGVLVVSPVVLLVGNASYSLYLFHPYFIQAVEKLMVPMKSFGGASLLAACIAILMATIFAIASFAWLEKPGNRWLRKCFLQKK